MHRWVLLLLPGGDGGASAPSDATETMASFLAEPSLAPTVADLPSDPASSGATVRVWDASIAEHARDPRPRKRSYM